jgi:hypothetical protein
MDPGGSHRKSENKKMKCYMRINVGEYKMKEEELADTHLFYYICTWDACKYAIDVIYFE